MPYYSPLRYPGGKRRLAPTVAELIDTNGLSNVEYVEPYAGGAAVALGLLFEERARRIHINDLNPAVHAFWHAVLNETEELVRRIESTPVDMDEWHRQRSVYTEVGDARSTDLAFACFFLNRANRSGILGGGVIGGQLQKGNWQIDARYNKADLVQRLKKIARYRRRISLYNEDAITLVERLDSDLPRDSFVFFDPPYIENGDDLYMNEYRLEDHRNLAKRIMALKTPWIVTYDKAAAREDLYGGHRQVLYDLSYSAQARYQGKEVMFISQQLRTPPHWESKEGPFVMSESGPRQILAVMSQG